jgi:hypothetical protein
VVTKTITIEGDGEPLTAEELAEIMNMSGAETTVCCGINLTIDSVSFSVSV